MSDYSQWPCDPRFKSFYKEIKIGDYSFLVPSGKLGQGQIDKAENARREAARSILSNDSALLTSLRKERKESLDASVKAARKYLDEADEKLKDRFARILVAISSQTVPEDSFVTDEDADYYVNQNKLSEPLHCAWTSALYIPFADSPAIKDIYDYIPAYVLMETQDFFVGSSSAPKISSTEMSESSTNANG